MNQFFFNPGARRDLFLLQVSTLKRHYDESE